MVHRRDGTAAAGEVEPMLMEQQEILWIPEESKGSEAAQASMGIGEDP
jgi:hypothetical protein